jgi:hypothetical protein
MDMTARPGLPELSVKLDRQILSLSECAIHVEGFPSKDLTIIAILATVGQLGNEGLQDLIAPANSSLASLRAWVFQSPVREQEEYGAHLNEIANLVDEIEGLLP